MAKDIKPHYIKDGSLKENPAYLFYYDDYAGEDVVIFEGVEIGRSGNRGMATLIAKQHAGII